MNKANKAVIIITIGLTIMVAGLGFLNYRQQQNREPGLGDTFFIISYGERSQVIDKEFLDNIGQGTVRANLKSSGKAAVKKNYIGVPLKKIVEQTGLDISSAQSAVFSAQDGYASSLTVKEIMAEKNVYIITGIEDGDLGNMKNGGYGPFLMITTQDPFSQRWCKYVTRVEFK